MSRKKRFKSRVERAIRSLVKKQQIKKIIQMLKSEGNKLRRGVTDYLLYRYLKSLRMKYAIVAPGKIHKFLLKCRNPFYKDHKF
ncbi:hypothetical protein [Leptospira noguchii]|uniref:Uncharacterized protein n=1 Tax=Leptospira noguchii str. 2001034031 TaxID=1193053 RepID=M6YRT3_9LEPT|nr:hypothetical protein [Leptospira noguchii]EMO89048.1 hypothetical protein LEP1GSC024_1692 [Leptospira noguchii str. 2001034031]